MPEKIIGTPLGNARQELFAQGVASGLPASRAYIAAGYKPSEPGASRLARIMKVAVRIRQLQVASANLVVIDAAWVLQKATELHDAAKAAGNFSAAARALELAGKHVDVQAFRERVEHGGRVEYANMTEEQIDARIAALLRDEPVVTIQ